MLAGQCHALPGLAADSSARSSSSRIATSQWGPVDRSGPLHVDSYFLHCCRAIWSAVISADSFYISARFIDTHFAVARAHAFFIAPFNLHVRNRDININEKNSHSDRAFNLRKTEGCISRNRKECSCHWRQPVIPESRLKQGTLPHGSSQEKNLACYSFSDPIAHEGEDSMTTRTRFGQSVSQPQSAAAWLDRKVH